MVGNGNKTLLDGTLDTVLVPLALCEADWQTAATPSLALRGCTRALVGLAPEPAPWADDTDCAYGDLSDEDEARLVARYGDYTPCASGNGTVNITINRKGE